MNSQGPQQHSITEAAAEWAVRLHAGALSEQEQAELRQWIARDFRKNRRLYSYLAVRNLLKGKASDLATLRPLMKRDPLLPLRMPFLFASFLLSERRKTRTAAQ